MTLYYACVTLMFMEPTGNGPCVPISVPQSEEQCVRIVDDWVRRALAWRARNGVYWGPFAACMPDDDLEIWNRARQREERFHG